MTEDRAENPKYLDPGSLETSFRTLNSSMTVTHGRYQIEIPCGVPDADWNHMDQLHRPSIHKTYEESLRLVMGRSFQLSLTHVPLGGFKFFMLVTDIQLGPGLFYQAFSLFNLWYIHCVIRMTPMSKKEGVGENLALQSIDWYIVSHRWLKFLHAPISRRLYRLNEVQNKEDTPVRIRRTQIRRKGYCFGSDQPDFINSNVLTDNVIPPKLEGIPRISLKEITPVGLNRVSAGPIELLVRKNGEQDFTLWPAVCPHEGGPLELGRVCNGTIICPWHDLKQKGATLTPDRPREVLGNLKLLLERDELVVCEKD